MELRIVSKLFNEPNEIVSLYLRNQYISDLQTQTGEKPDDGGAHWKAIRR